MRRLFQVTTGILAGAGLLLIGLGCGGDDGPGDPGGGTACSIEFYFPDPGGDYLTGDTINLRWNTAGSGQVKITLLKAGAEQGVIRAAILDNGFYSWTASTMGAASGADFAVAVTNTDDTACGDTLSLAILDVTNCGITPTFLPANPAYTDTVNAGADYTITWDSESTSGFVDVEFWYFTGVENTFITELAVGTPDDGEFVWEDVDSFHFGTSNNYYIKIVDSSVGGCEAESRMFRIVDDDVCDIVLVEPNNSSSYDEGGSMLIRFVRNFSGPVDILLYEGLENRLDWIATNVEPVNDEYTWQVIAVPDTYEGLETSFRVKVVATDDQFCSAFSQTFTIRLDP